MEEQNNEIFERLNQAEPAEEKALRDPKAGIVFVEVFCVTVLLIGVMVIKTFFPAYFGTIKKWYKDNFTVDTSVSEVLQQSDGGTDEV